MERLIHKGVPVTVLNNWYDMVIPQGARMHDDLEGYKDKPNVTLAAGLKGHINLTDFFKMVLAERNGHNPIHYKAD